MGTAPHVGDLVRRADGCGDPGSGAGAGSEVGRHAPSEVALLELAVPLPDEGVPVRRTGRTRRSGRARPSLQGRRLHPSMRYTPTTISPATITAHRGDREPRGSVHRRPIRQPWRTVSYSVSDPFPPTRSRTTGCSRLNLARLASWVPSWAAAWRWALPLGVSVKPRASAAATSTPIGLRPRSVRSAGSPPAPDRRPPRSGRIRSRAGSLPTDHPGRMVGAVPRRLAHRRFSGSPEAERTGRPGHGRSSDRPPRPTTKGRPDRGPHRRYTYHPNVSATPGGKAISKGSTPLPRVAGRAWVPELPWTTAPEGGGVPVGGAGPGRGPVPPDNRPDPAPGICKRGVGFGQADKAEAEAGGRAARPGRGRGCGGRPIDWVRPASGSSDLPFESPRGRCPST